MKSSGGRNQLSQFLNAPSYSHVQIVNLQCECLLHFNLHVKHLELFLGAQALGQEGWLGPEGLHFIQAAGPWITLHVSGPLYAGK